MTNSNFNLSFKDNNFKNEYTKKKEQPKVEESLDSKDSDWLEVVEKKNSTFGKTNKLMDKFNAFSQNKVL